MVIWGM